MLHFFARAFALTEKHRLQVSENRLLSKILGLMTKEAAMD